jgi:hypothetical protein
MGLEAAERLATMSLREVFLTYSGTSLRQALLAKAFAFVAI